mgnify:CR=1 FL=1
MKRIILYILSSIAVLSVSAQTFEADYLPPATLKSNDGERIGKGDMLKLGATFKKQLSAERDENGRIKMWDMTFNARYASMDYEGIANALNPDAILNGGIMLTHVRTIGKRWNMVASLGASLNAVTDCIRWQSLNMNGGLIFMYSANRDLHLGIGAAVTTLYDTPILFPLPYIAWEKEGKYSIELNMRGVPEMSISTELNKKATLELKPFKMERMAAVIEHKGKDMVYSMSTFSSLFSFRYRITENAAWTASIGYVWRRSIKNNERSWSGFWNSITDYDNRCKFDNGFRFSTGIKFDIK